jgi:hypothetical protein
MITYFAEKHPCYEWTATIFLNSVNQLIFIIVKYGVLFEVRTEFLNNILTSFSFKGLNSDYFL